MDQKVWDLCSGDVVTYTLSDSPSLLICPCFFSAQSSEKAQFNDYMVKNKDETQDLL